MFASKERLKAIAERVSQELRRVLMEETNVETDEDEQTLTSGDMVTFHLKEGLGANWPPEEESSEPQHIAEGAAEYFEKLQAGEIERTLMPTSAYDDGAFHIYIIMDLR